MTPFKNINLIMVNMRKEINFPMSNLIVISRKIIKGRISIMMYTLK